MRRMAVLGWLVLAVASPALAGNGFKIYVDELDPPVMHDVLYGYEVMAVCELDFTRSCGRDDDCNKGDCPTGGGVCSRDATLACSSDADCALGSCGTTVDALTPGSQTTVWDLACDPAPGGECQADSWDFSGVTTAHFPGIIEIGTTNVPVASTETCSWNKCGFNRPAAVLFREDRNFDRSLGGYTCDDGTTPCTQNPACAGIGTGLCRQRGLCDDGTTVCGLRVCSNDTTLTCIDDADCSGTCLNDCAGIGAGECHILNVTLSALEREEGVKMCTGDGTICENDAGCAGGESCVEGSNIWLRAAIQNELEVGSLGEGETRICYADNGGTTRTGVPLFRFVHADAQGSFMELGDRWIATFDCEQNIFNHRCEGSVNDPCNTFLCQQKSYGCSATCGTSGTQDFGGKQESEIVNEGTVTLPSGHTFDALVVRQNAEFCVSPSLFGCSIDVPVRTVIYMWQVPHLRTVVRLMSVQLACDTEELEFMAVTDFKFGLFPPREIQVTGTGADSVDLWWDPGLITDRIGSVGGDYRIYWDTDSGSVDDYAFNSFTHPGQVSFAGTTAIVTGLTPGTPYYFTVTARSDYTDPGTCLYDACETTEYESLRYPEQLTGGPVAIPQEVGATPGAAGDAGAVPDGDGVAGVPLAVARQAGGMLDLTWSGSCVGSDTDYEIYEGSIGGNFTTHTQVVCTTGGATAAQIAPSAGDRYYLVVPHNGSSEGSYGRQSGGGERPVSVSPCRAQSIGSPVCP